MSADKVQDALNAVLGNDGGGHDCECSTCYHLRVNAHALIAAVREDEREQAVARFLAMGPWTEESGERIVEAIRNA